MRTSVAQAKARFSEMIETARSGEPVIVTRHGEPVVAVVPVPQDPEERERFLLAHNPVFRNILEMSRGSGEPIPHDEIWRLVAKRRSRPPAAKPNKRHARDAKTRA
ncbi:MAG: type II toxin-antitoxin system Phd/YefM family antitoxin [Candidatus Binatia bacterium]